MTFTPHIQRLISAIVFACLIILAFLLDDIWLCILVILITVLALYEYQSIVLPKGLWPEKIINLILVACLPLSGFFAKPHALLLCIIAAFTLVAFSFLFRFGFSKQSQGSSSANEINSASQANGISETSSASQANSANGVELTSLSLFLFGFIYVALPLQLVFFISYLELVLTILAVVCSDTAAFYIGVRFGKRKIWPKVSPKKSVEGSLASFLACFLLVSVFGTIFISADIAYLPEWCLVGIFINIAAQLGDFFESALKRFYAVKDSGKLMPGHGGILDRIDSLLFVLPTYFILKIILFT